MEGNPAPLCNLGLVQQKTIDNELKCGHKEFEAVSECEQKWFRN